MSKMVRGEIIMAIHQTRVLGDMAVKSVARPMR